MLLNGLDRRRPRLHYSFRNAHIPCPIDSSPNLLKLSFLRRPMTLQQLGVRFQITRAVEVELCD
jgi:hypothetical protein